MYRHQRRLPPDPGSYLVKRPCPCRTADDAPVLLAGRDSETGIWYDPALRALRAPDIADGTVLPIRFCPLCGRDLDGKARRLG